MSNLTLEKLCEIINWHFGEPFLVKDGVCAELIEDEDEGTLLAITIGRRNISIDRDGEIIDTGTFMGVPDDSLTI